MADDLLVSNVRPYGAEPTDILIRAGKLRPSEWFPRRQACRCLTESGNCLCQA